MTEVVQPVRQKQEASRIALVCPTVGQTQRGYERFIVDLFRFLQPVADITLFKGDGECRSGERVIGHMKRTGKIGLFHPEILRYPRYHLEFATFAFNLAPVLMREEFDIVHFIDPPLGRLFHFVRGMVKKKFRLLFSNAAPTSYNPLHWSDHIHCFSPDFLERSKETGYPPDRLTLLPSGYDPAVFDTNMTRSEFRQREGIPEDCLVVLAVTSLNRYHKRVDYLIEELAPLEGNFLLWLDGGAVPDGDVSLLDLAKARLGRRFRHSHLPSGRIGELFRMADLFVSSSIVESFGMSIVEAMSSGLPALIHDSPHFHWLTNDCAGAYFADMSVVGNLCSALRRIMQTTLPRGCSGEMRDRYEWLRIKDRYLDMYRAVLTQPLAGGAFATEKR
jgi:glycosyltransferase involved in cell wall biosynthesis